jgi:hypothetical protein
VFWGAFAQLLVFHVFSWPVVGFFYPVLMFGILAIYPLCWALDAATDDGAGRQRMRAAWIPFVPASWRGAFALAAAFSALQLTPHFFPGDGTLTGEGRLFALHMFDARITCEAWADVRRTDGSVRRENLRKHWETRTACDPILIHGFARNLCRARDAGRLAFVDLDVHLRSRRTSERDYRSVIDFADFCARRPRYRPFGHNDWILSAAAQPAR